MRLEVIGQRLLTGRLCIAQAALVFARTLFARADAYARSKPVWSPVGAPKLVEMPQLRAVFTRADKGLSEVSRTFPPIAHAQSRFNWDVPILSLLRS